MYLAGHGAGSFPGLAFYLLEAEEVPETNGFSRTVATTTPKTAAVGLPAQERYPFGARMK